MGGRGSESGGRAGGGGGVGSGDILNSTSLISERERNPKMVDESLDTLKELKAEYNREVDDLSLAKLKASKGGVLGFSDGQNISINDKWFNDNMQKAYAESVKSGYHPSNGNKTAVQAVMAHEFGHNLTYSAGIKMGFKINPLSSAADKIVQEARVFTKERGVVKMSAKISKYATVSNAEAIAEAVSDVYCNGSKATSQSKAIVSVLKKYL